MNKNRYFATPIFRRAAIRWLCLVPGLIGTISTSAQVPALISNQGRLFDGKNMVDGYVALTLRVYTNATEGTFLYEDISRVEVVDGYYATFLGDNTTFGYLSEALAFGEAYVEVSVDGVVFPPRELISSVAYSFRAGEADGLRVDGLASDMIGDEVVREHHLADGAISSRALGLSVVTEDHLADDSVSQDKLAPGVRATLDRISRSADPGAGARARNQAIRVEPSAESPNVIVGHIANHADAAAVGAVVGGGGSVDQPNVVRSNYAGVQGGAGNVAGGPYSAVGGGLDNTASGSRSAVAGGRLNEAAGSSAAVAGGYRNIAAGNYSVIGGGYANQATGYVAQVSGGWNNQAAGPVSTIGGGQENRAGGAASVVSGGWKNEVDELGATVAGGYDNRGSGPFASVAGGSNNVASGSFSATPGGRGNVASGTASLAAGSQAVAQHDGSFVWADSQPTAFGSTGPDQVLIRARGNVGIDTVEPLEKLTVAGNIAPAADGRHDLGSDTLRWRRAHLSDGIDASQNMSFTFRGQTNLTVMTNGVIWVPGTLVADQIVGDGSGLTGVASAVLSDGAILDRMIHAEAGIAPEKVAGHALTRQTRFGGDVQGTYENLLLKPGSVDARALATDALSAELLPDGSIGVEKLKPGLLDQIQRDQQEGSWSLGGNTVGSADDRYLGTIDAHPLELRVAGRPALRLEPTPSGVNLVAGHPDNRVATTVEGATISGGGGTSGAHQVTGSYGTVGGLGNKVGNEYATVAGGINNTAAGSAATVAGGWKNAANDLDATVGGGQDNVAGGSASTIAGGFDNQAAGNYSAVPGGISNLAQGDYAMAAGRGAQSLHDGAFVWADSSAEPYASTAPDQFLIRASGNVGIDTVAPSEKLTVSGNVAPSESGRYSLGSSAMRWQSVYLSEIDFGAQASFVSGGQVVLSIDRDGNLVASGSVRAPSFVGDGSGLSGINGSALSAGSITDEQVSQAAGIDPRKIQGIALTEDARFSGDVQGTAKSLVLQDGAVRGAKLADGAVTAAKLRQRSIGTEHLTDELRATLGKAPSTWKLGGNAGTKADRDYLGTSDREPFHLTVNGARALRLEPTSQSPNIVLGEANNQVARGVVSGVVGGGGSAKSPNQVRGNFGTVGGGVGNISGDEYATVSGGFGNEARGFDTTISGGQDNQASGSGSSIGGGFTNRTSGSFSTIGGGADNRAGGNVSVVAGGFGNLANGAYSMVPGGAENRAEGAYAMAAGRRAKANHPGAYVWSDSKDADFSSTGNDQYVIRAAGGVGIGMNRPEHLLHLAGGAYSDGSTWANASDENRKEDFEPVDVDGVLDRMMQLPIQTWSYKDDTAGSRHIGPTAQAFHRAFSVGSDDVSISTVDAQGVVMAAIQALARENDDLRNSNQDLRRRLQALERELETGPAGIAGPRRTAVP